MSELLSILAKNGRSKPTFRINCTIKRKVSHMTYSQRDAMESDLSFVRHVHEASMRPHFESQFGVWDETFQKQKFSEPASIADHEILEVNEKPIGCAFVIEYPDRLVLARLWLLPEFQSKGIGTSFIKRLSEYADSLDLPVEISVLRSNRARFFYERLGFEIIGEAETTFDMRRAANR